MAKFKPIGILVLLSILASCAWFDKSEHVKIVGDYQVGWNDLVRNRCITKPNQICDGCFDIIIDDYVYAVGHNESFIIAKQHPGIDTVSSNYFIIDIKEHGKTGKKGIYGPLTLNEFDSLSTKLKISGLPFDLNYPENP